MTMTTILSKFQIVIPKEVREKLHLSPKQRLHVVAQGGIITLVPEVPLTSLKGTLKGMHKGQISGKRRTDHEGPHRSPITFHMFNIGFASDGRLGIPTRLGSRTLTRSRAAPRKVFSPIVYFGLLFSLTQYHAFM